MSRKKKIWVAAASAAIGVAFLFCGDPVKPLEWRVTVDVPINEPLRVWQREPYVLDITMPEPDTVIIDMASHEFYLDRDMLATLRKFRDPTAVYNVKIDNSQTSSGFVFYALFAPPDLIFPPLGKSLRDMTVEEVYRVITENNYDTLLSNYNYINVLDSTGLVVSSGATVIDSIEIWNSALCGIIIENPSIAWRWLAKLSWGDYLNLPLSEEEADVIDTRFRLRVSGISNFDSLTTLFGDL